MSTKKPRPFTPVQQGLINGIVAYGVAPLEEVEAALRARTTEAGEKISRWKSDARRRQAEEYQKHLDSLTRYEPCAVPGCPNTIELKVLEENLTHPELSRLWPEPTRTVQLSIQMRKGEGLIRANAKIITKRYYGCSVEHKEAIFRMEFDIVSTLNMEEEKRIGGFAYPVEVSEEAQQRVRELARNAAIAIVSIATEKDLKHIRRTIQVIAETQLDLLITTADLERLTDNLEKFKALYVDDFVYGYREALRIRAMIDEGRVRSEAVSSWGPMWQDYARRRQQSST